MQQLELEIKDMKVIVKNQMQSLNNMTETKIKNLKDHNLIEFDKRDREMKKNLSEVE